MEEHISLKRIHGVGDTKQWRRRLIHQIEDRIKDRRESIHNAKRGEFSLGGAGAGSNKAKSGEGTFSGVVAGGTVPVAVGSGQEAFVFGQGLGGLAAGPGPGFGLEDLAASADCGDRAQTYISEEEERRIVAEVWEAFKNENYEALVQAFQGMTDKEIEDIEQDILLHNYGTDSDPMYETIMEMEESHTEEYVQHYMNQQNQPENEQEKIANDEMTTALSIAWTLLSSTPCIRCHQGAVMFEPVLPGSLSEGARAVCSGVQGNGAGNGGGGGGCGLRLERDALVHLANVGNTHR
ncbi:hypothetical protein BGZ95_010729 [Linnemannia exigua]|uniref:Uncharacterized protein n=1 Tax=Linnemannia exigua TaxID=604196 RepID=A0AAD4DAZ8_9FUNG|nr:hypothetical protein BGZ95_010729 [Linnemannia exigua]